MTAYNIERILMEKDVTAKRTQIHPEDLTCQLPRDKPAPAAQQRSASNPAAHCPAFLPYSAEFGDGSG